MFKLLLLLSDGAPAVFCVPFILHVRDGVKSNFHSIRLYRKGRRRRKRRGFGLTCIETTFPRSVQSPFMHLDLFWSARIGKSNEDVALCVPKRVNTSQPNAVMCIGKDKNVSWVYPIDVLSMCALNFYPMTVVDNVNIVLCLFGHGEVAAAAARVGKPSHIISTEHYYQFWSISWLRDVNLSPWSDRQL